MCRTDRAGADGVVRQGIAGILGQWLRGVLAAVTPVRPYHARMQSEATSGERAVSVDRETALRLEVALAAAHRAGEKTLEYFADPKLAVETKRDGSVVTAADRETELVLRADIADAFPGDAILGEEHDDKVGTTGWRWIIDPIDGTKSFVHGVPLYGTLVAVENQSADMVEVGVIHMPALDETVWAARGGGAWHSLPGERAEVVRALVSDVHDLSDAMVLATAWDYFIEQQCADIWLEVVARAGATRGWSDCYAHLLVATGRAEAVIEPELNPWDIAPMLPIMAEAGGMCTDFAGVASAFTGNGIASNGHVHEAIRALVQQS